MLRYQCASLEKERAELRAGLQAAREKMAALEDVVNHGQKDSVLALNIKDSTIERLQRKLLDEREQAAKLRQDLVREFAHQREELSLELCREKARRQGLQILLEEGATNKDAPASDADDVVTDACQEEDTSTNRVRQMMQGTSSRSRKRTESTRRQVASPSATPDSSVPSVSPSRHCSSPRSSRQDIGVPRSPYPSICGRRATVQPLRVEYIGSTAARSSSCEQPSLLQRVKRPDAEMQVDVDLRSVAAASSSRSLSTSRRHPIQLASRAESPIRLASAPDLVIRGSSSGSARSMSPLLSPSRLLSAVGKVSTSPANTSRSISPAARVVRTSTALPAPRAVMPTSVLSSLPQTTVTSSSVERTPACIRRTSPVSERVPSVIRTTSAVDREASGSRTRCFDGLQRTSNVVSAVQNSKDGLVSRPFTAPLNALDYY